MMRAFLSAAVLLASAACGFNKDPNCQWPSDHASRALDLSSAADRRHLADDAQTAEDLAIRHADASHGRTSRSRDVDAYHRVRQECMERLAATIATQHSVPDVSVAKAVGDRRAWLDAIVIGILAIAFGWIARIVSRSMLRGALADSRALAAGMIVAAALAAGVAGLMGSGVFIGLIESVRVGNGHMSYRVERLPLRDRPVETFAASAAIFAAVAAEQYRRAAINRS